MKTDETTDDDAQRVPTSKTTGIIKVRLVPLKPVRQNVDTSLSDRYSRMAKSDWFLAAYENGALEE